MRKKGVIKALIDILIVALCIVGAFFASNYLFSKIPVKGDSMENTIHDNDKVIIYTGIRESKYRYGDIVVFSKDQEYAGGTTRLLIKRIIGLPGDTIEIIRDADGTYHTWRNGKKLEEDYLADDHQLTGEMARVVVGEGEFFYMGDNRPRSFDSREDGMGKLANISGLVIMRFVQEENEMPGDLQIVKRLK